MFRWLIFGFLMIAIVAVSAATYVLMHRPLHNSPEWVEGYSGQVTFNDLRDRSKSYRGFVYSNVLAQPRAFRMDMNFSEHKLIRVWRQDVGSTFMLDPDAKTVWTPRLKGSARLVVGRGPYIENGVKRLVGQERINGRLADHWEITHLGAATEEHWEDVRLHVTLKSVQPGVSTYELTNVREGHQRDELFTIPEGYRQIAPPETGTEIR